MQLIETPSASLAGAKSGAEQENWALIGYNLWLEAPHQVAGPDRSFETRTQFETALKSDSVFLTLNECQDHSLHTLRRMPSY